MKDDISFTESLISAMPNDPAKVACLSTLRLWAGETVYIPVESFRDTRIGEALKMLKSGMDQSEIAEALRIRFKISKRTSWRDIYGARKLRQMSE